MRKFSRDKIATYLFIFVQAVLYLAFLKLDIIGGNISVSSKIKFTIIILCFCYALLIVKSSSKGIFSGPKSELFPPSIFFKGALLFTVAADYCLLITNYYFMGVLSFIIVQQFYGICLDITGSLQKEKRKIPFIPFLIRFFVQVILTFGVTIVLERIGVSIDALLIITVLYFISIVTNTFRAVWEAFHYDKDRKDRKYNILFAVGMVLFILCDLNVGLFHLADYIVMSKEKYEFLDQLSSILMWMFYAPSQVLITLSGNRHWHS